MVFIWILNVVAWMLEGFGLWSGASQPIAWWYDLASILLSPYDVLSRILTASATALIGAGLVLVLSERGFIGIYGLMMFASLVFALTFLGPAVATVMKVGDIVDQLMQSIVGVNIPPHLAWALNALAVLLTVIALLDLWRGQRLRDLGV